MQCYAELNASIKSIKYGQEIRKKGKFYNLKNH